MGIIRLLGWIAFGGAALGCLGGFLAWLIESPPLSRVSLQLFLVCLLGSGSWWAALRGWRAWRRERSRTAARDQAAFRAVSFTTVAASMTALVLVRLISGIALKDSVSLQRGAVVVGALNALAYLWVCARVWPRLQRRQRLSAGGLALVALGGLVYAMPLLAAPSVSASDLQLAALLLYGSWGIGLHVEGGPFGVQSSAHVGV